MSVILRLRAALALAIAMAGLSGEACWARPPAPVVGVTSPTDCVAPGAGLPAEGTPFRPLPIVIPADGANGRALSLKIDAIRTGEGDGSDAVMIGDIRVRGVPVFAVMPEGATRVVLPDPNMPAGTTLAGHCLSSPDWAYGGMVWSLNQGDILRMTLESRLDFRRGEFAPPPAGGVSCRGANVHTHGLLVSPYKLQRSDGLTLYGDYVLDVTAPPATDAQADPCAGAQNDAGRTEHVHGTALGAIAYETKLPGSPGENLHTPGGHPSGVFWFHPHPHGYTALETSGGTTGVITVGALADYACLAVGGGGCGPPTGVNVRYLLLKDAEVAPDKGEFRLLYSRAYDLEDDCNSAGSRGLSRPGQCSDWKGRRWIFTVNGVRDPVIADVRPGGLEVWRIVNASPNVTYRLRLLALGANAEGEALPFKVLSLEGAAPAASGRVQPGEAREVLLMPAARAEIAVTGPATGGVYALEQMGFSTNGDVWPSMRLATVRFPAASGVAAPSVELHGPVAAPGPGSSKPDRYYAPADTPSCGFAADTVRRIYFVQKPTFTDDRRRMNIFGLLAAVQRPGAAPIMFDAAGAPVELNAKAWQALLASDHDAPAFMHNPFGAICTYLGHTETWILENDTAEDHNFHIHQSEFQLALDRAGDPAFFSAPPGRSVDPLLGASDLAVGAADGRGREAEEAILYHDTIPVPRGVGLGGRGCDGSPMNTNCRPGRVTIRIRFDRDEQVGEFVYHCHILQHEDNGMMALVKVLCPPGDTACAARTAPSTGDGIMQMGGMRMGGGGAPP